MSNAAARIVRRDRDLARVLETYGEPPEWRREPGFATLVHIILEQQVSLASARRTFEALHEAIGTPTPAAVLGLDDVQLKAIGFSRQKARYVRALARSLLDGELELERLEDLPDERVHAELTAIVGIGAWTAAIYLLMVLRRPDVFPRGDLAVAIAVRELRELRERPTPSQLERIAEAWRPHRSYAVRLLWHYYLSRRPRA